MKQSPRKTSRRHFLQLTAGTTLAMAWPNRLASELRAADRPRTSSAPKVCISRCREYGPEVKAALRQSFDRLGGIQQLVRNKTVTVKLNLTSTNFLPVFQRPVGESFMTHEATAFALAALLFENGARRVRLVESTNSRATLSGTLSLADWDLRAFEGLGKIEYENTRNKGQFGYGELPVPAGRMFSSFQLNRAYLDTDVLISLAKLKQHLTTGVTLSMKNLFGITPNALYGDQAGNEEATAGRGPLHDPRRFEHVQLPGLKPGISSVDPGFRVPRIVVDICVARPIDLAIVDGISSMTGGEGPWAAEAQRMRLVKPGLLIVGLNPVATDAVATRVMGFANPRAARGFAPFENSENFLLLAEKAGLGTADLNQIELSGLQLPEAIYPFV